MMLSSYKRKSSGIINTINACRLNNNFQENIPFHNRIYTTDLCKKIVGTDWYENVNVVETTLKGAYVQISELTIKNYKF